MEKEKKREFLAFWIFFFLENRRGFPVIAGAAKAITYKGFVGASLMLSTKWPFREALHTQKKKIPRKGSSKS